MPTNRKTAKTRSAQSLLDVGPDAKVKRRRKAGVRPRHKVSEASLANLRRGGRDLDVPPDFPVLTDAIAADYVKLRAAGLPPLDAVAYFAKSLPQTFTKTRLQEWALLWEHSALVSAAWEHWRGGTWPDLDPDRRLELALDHHLAQMAYCLLTSDFNHPDANLRKLAEARDAIQGALETRRGSESAKFEAFLQAVIKNAERGLPTAQPATGLPILNSVPELTNDPH